jgi:hypothetical protein
MGFGMSTIHTGKSSNSPERQPSPVDQRLFPLSMSEEELGIRGTRAKATDYTLIFKFRFSAFFCRMGSTTFTFIR